MQKGNYIEIVYFKMLEIEGCRMIYQENYEEEKQMHLIRQIFLERLFVIYKF